MFETTTYHTQCEEMVRCFRLSAKDKKKKERSACFYFEEREPGRGSWSPCCERHEFCHHNDNIVASTSC